MMLAQVVALVVVVLLGLAAIGIVGFLGLRAKWPLVQKTVISLQRAIVNPIQMRSAGTPGADVAIVRHRGRISGRAYKTPVGAVATDDGFLIALPYGSRTDWLRNVLASGSATIVHEGHAYAVDRPEVVPMPAVEAWFSAPDRRSHRLFGVDECLRVRKVDAGIAAGRIAARG